MLNIDKINTQSQNYVKKDQIDNQKQNKEQEQPQPITDHLEIMQKPVRLRTRVDIEYLLEQTGNIKFFQQYQQKFPDLHELCCIYMKYETYKKDSFVFEYNTIGQKFYIILDGSIQVIVPIKQIMTVVAQLSNGQYFGELALINDAPRNASIKCDLDSHFATLDKSIFMILFNKLEEEQLNKNSKFLIDIPLFKSFKREQLRQIWKQSQEINYIVGQDVFKVEDEADNFYVVKQGDFVVFIIQIKKQDYIRIQTFIITLGQQIKIGIIQGILVLSEGQIFGEEDILSDQKRSYSIICKSDQGILLKMTKNQFKQIIMNFPETKQYIMDIQEQKQQAIQNQKTHVNQIIQDYTKYFYDQSKQYVDDQKDENVQKQNKLNIKSSSGSLKISQLRNKLYNPTINLKKDQNNDLKTDTDQLVQQIRGSKDKLYNPTINFKRDQNNNQKTDKKTDNDQFIQQIDKQKKSSQDKVRRIINPIYLNQIIDKNKPLMKKYFDMIGDDIDNYTAQNKQKPEYQTINYEDQLAHDKLIKSCVNIQQNEEYNNEQEDWNFFHSSKQKNKFEQLPHKIQINVKNNYFYEKKVLSNSNYILLTYNDILDDAKQRQDSCSSDSQSQNRLIYCIAKKRQDCYSSDNLLQVKQLFKKFDKKNTYNENQKIQYFSPFPKQNFRRRYLKSSSLDKRSLKSSCADIYADLQSSKRDNSLTSKNQIHDNSDLITSTSKNNISITSKNKINGNSDLLKNLNALINKRRQKFYNDKNFDTNRQKIRKEKYVYQKSPIINNSQLNLVDSQPEKIKNDSCLLRIQSINNSIVQPQSAKEVQINNKKINLFRNQASSNSSSQRQVNKMINKSNFYKQIYIQVKSLVDPQYLNQLIDKKELENNKIQ